MALSDEWRDVIREWESERLIGGHGTVKRRAHAKRLRDFKPDIEAMLRQGPCVVCGGERGRADVMCETCEREGV